MKIAAVRAVLERLRDGITIDGLAVPSGVPEQPVGDDVTIQGALARARGARDSADADFGVGIEGGVVQLDDGRMRTCAWAAVAARDGSESVGGSLAMPLPDEVARLIRDGLELGHAIDRVAGTTNIKHGAGAVGILTAGLVDRQRAYEVIIAYALAPYLGQAQARVG